MSRIPAKYVGGPCDGDTFSYDPAKQVTFWRTCGGTTYVPSPLPAVPVEWWPAATAEAYGKAKARGQAVQFPRAWHRLMHTLARTGPAHLRRAHAASLRIRRAVR